MIEQNVVSDPFSMFVPGDFSSDPNDWWCCSPTGTINIDSSDPLGELTNDWGTGYLIYHRESSEEA
jgi:hypothetical protein